MVAVFVLLVDWASVDHHSLVAIIIIIIVDEFMHGEIMYGSIIISIMNSISVYKLMYWMKMKAL